MTNHMHTGRPMQRTLLLAVAGLAFSFAQGCGAGDSTTAPADPTIVASVTVSPPLDTLVSIGETVQLGAAVRNAAGGPVPSADVAWTSDNASVISLTSTGLVTGLTNGTAVVRAAAGGVQGSATIVVRQRAATLEVVEGADQGAMAGMALDTAIVLVAKDALGNPVQGAVVDFAPATGTAEPAQATADAEGRVTTTWTMSTLAGTTSLTASVSGGTAQLSLDAVTFAAAPSVIAMSGGDDQSEVSSLPLAEPIRVIVHDEFGNAVPDVQVIFTPAGDATLDSTDVRTNLLGVASTTWTLGATLGTQTVSAAVADSVIPEGVVISGGPIVFSATAVAYDVLEVTSGVPVSGQSATVSATGLSIDPQDHVVTVDGIEAAITGGTQSSLTFTVPSFGCVPERPRRIEVVRSAMTDGIDRAVRPAGVLSLEVGERVILPAEGDKCLQLPSALGGTDEYLVGLTATARVNAELLVQLVAADNSSAEPPPAPASPVWDAMQSVSGAMQGMALLSAGTTASPDVRHRTLRDWESRFLSTKRRTATRRASLRLTTARASAVGDMLSFRVPDVRNDPCNGYTAVNARVIAETPGVIVATDATMPSGPLVEAAVQSVLNGFMNRFDGVLRAAAVGKFGALPDVDGNGRVTLLFTPAVIPTGMAAFSSAVDALGRTTCPASDEGEVIYIAIPQVPDVAALTALLSEGTPAIAHELIHVIESRRIAQGGAPLAPWLAEGLAEVGMEIMGLVEAGLSAQADLGAADLGANGAAALAWLTPRFDRLSSLFGWDGATGRLVGAPHGCSLFGFGGLSVPCRDDFAAGAAWSFMRYVVDRIVLAAPSGEAGLLSGLIDLNPSTDGRVTLASITGSTLEELMVEWAMMLYADGRIAAAVAPELQMGSWDLVDVFTSLPEAQRLVPNAHGFAPFAEAWSVVGGGTAYATVSASGAHGALAIRALDAGGEALGSVLGPRMWVVRVR